MPAITTSGYSAGRFLIELEGQPVGAASSVRGGEAVGDVVSTAGPGGLVKKRIANVHREPITFTVGVAMDPGLAGWIATFLSRTAGPKDGAIVFLDVVGKVRSRLQWRGGILTEVRFPGCDAGSPETGEVTVTLQPETVTTSTGGGAAEIATDPRRAAPWSRQRFRLSVSGMTQSPGFVASIEPFTVRRPLPADEIGSVRDPVASPVPQQVSDLVLTVPDARAEEFDQWSDDFLINGNNAESDERTATLEYLGPTLDPLATLTFQHVGIVRVGRERSRSGNTVTARAQVRLYCEEATFSVRGAAGSQSPGRTAGVDLGQRWAAERASLEELAGLVAPDDPDWTAVTLPRDHSLIAVLRDAEVLPPGETGPVEVPRHPLVEGLLEGIGLVGAELADPAADPAVVRDPIRDRFRTLLERRDRPAPDA